MARKNKPAKTAPAKPRTPAPAAKPWEHAKSGEGSASDPLAARFVESLSYDRRLYKHDIAGSIVHARMLNVVGLIKPKELKEIERGLSEIGKEIEAAGADYGAAWPGWKVELEDVHMCIEAALIEKIGDAGRKLHTGRSRNDQVAADLMFWIRDSIWGLGKKFSPLFRALFTLAERDGGIVMPAYTHLQRAQPIVVGGELIAWAQAFSRSLDRFDALYELLEFPLGSGAIAGSSLGIDRKETAWFAERANLLDDFDKPDLTRSSIDGTASRDMACDFLYALAMTAMTLSRWAEQWIIYASTEFSFITLDNRYTTGSSMMPQKRNPDMLELIRGRCGNVYGHLVALLTILKGLPIGYNRDLQEDKRHVFAAYDIVSDSIEMAARIVATTKFNEAKIAQGLDRGFLDATSLAEYLVTKGVPFRTAHQVVGALVRSCESRGYHKLGQLTLDDFNAACAAASQPKVCANDVYDWLGPENVVKRYRTYGNAGVSGFAEQLKAWKERLK
ncbi:MAG: argininosuccinate lyase [Planctomycetes bacterium]|nr:argininosuccinate lyase [Planctomycetota bacterium]